MLMAADRLLGTHLVEWELDRRQRRIERLTAEMDAVNQHLDALNAKLSLHRLVFCLLELKARSERDDLHDWLRFAPHEEGEEAVLDSAIECLVKPRLASLDAEPGGSGHYVYRLHPDWPAIVARLRNASMVSDLASWLDERMPGTARDGQEPGSLVDTAHHNA